jgi:hypothetical protein
MPDTGFGFKGIVVYTDNSPNAKVFVSHKYKLNAKPDIIFKVWRNRYALVEYKSRSAGVKESDVNQAIASIIAARAQYNICYAYVVTASETKEIREAKLSNRKLFGKIRSLHRTAYKIKNEGHKPLKPEKVNCHICAYKHLDCK